MSDVQWFNPRQIPKKDFLALETGRKYLIKQLLYTIEQNVSQNGTNIHWLITGTRGAGKSFFLRYAQLLIEEKYNARPQSKMVKVVLLPEELENVYSPHALLDAVSHILKKEAPANATWNNDNPIQKWKDSLSKLLNSFTEDLLVVAIENFDDVLKKAFKDDVYASLLRKLLTEESRIMFLVSDVEGIFDKNYNKRLFEQFEYHDIKPWNKKNHRSYLAKRAKLDGIKITSKQLSKIDSYSRYTGGNPRVAAILATAILYEDNFISASKDLNASLDKVSDYYRALLGQLPDRSRQLFHALINGKEPCSQPELAKRVGATQSEISQAFKVIKDLGYLQSKKVKGKKAIYYQVLDRLFVQWYRMRHIQPDENSHLAIMANLLTEIIDFQGKLKHAQQLFDDEQEQDAHFLIDMALQEKRLDISKLTDNLPNKIKTGKHLNEFETLENKFKSKSLFFMAIYLAGKYNNDEKFKNIIKEVKKIILCQEYISNNVSQKKFIKLTENSLSLSIIEKFRVYVATTQNLNKKQWDELIKVFLEEKEKFKKIELEHPDDIKKLEAGKSNSLKYPWSSIWEGHDEFFSNNFKASTLTEPERDLILCAMLAMAILNREKNPDLPYTNDLSRSFEKILIKLRNKHGIPSEYMTLLELFISKITFGDTFYNIAIKQYLPLESENPKIFSFVKKSFENKDIPLETKSIFLERLGWYLGKKKEWELAFNAHAEVCDMDISSKSWNIGQAARYQFNMFGFDKAWSFLESHWEEYESEKKWIIQQLGDCLMDAQNSKGESAVYGVGRELLSQFSKKKDINIQSIIRLLFIDAVAMKVSLNALIDLASDLREIFTDTFDFKELEELELLSKTLIDWFVYLQLTPKERDQKDLLDPDWETTLKGLNEGIDTQARLYYKLTEKAIIGKEAKEMFETICGLMNKF